MKIIRHRLHADSGDPIPFVASPNTGGAVTHEYLVMHFTAGRSAESSIRWLTNAQSRASAHLVIARDGAITQLVPFNRVAWHAGLSAWGGRVGLNQFSLGIELANAGPLQKHAEGWRAWWGGTFSDDDVMEATHRHETAPRGWHLYTTEQLDAALDVAALLVRHYRLLDVVGHEDISPGRKVDPGPAFPLRSFRGHVMGRADDADAPLETTTALNIRVGPGTIHEKLPASPLRTGTPVLVLAEQGSWRFVDVLDDVNGEMDLQGWVHGRFLRPSRVER